MTEATRQSVLFPSLLGKPVRIAFDEPSTSSDGGAMLLKAVDERLHLTKELAAALHDERQGGKVVHTLADLVRHRVFGLALGYADTNDVARIGGDAMFRLLLDRDPISGLDLASQPTLSRFENGATSKDLYRMGMAVAKTVIAYHKRRLGRRRVKRVTIDMDPTDTPTYGAQQLTFFNTHYDNYCYLPLLGFVTFNDEVEQYAFAAVLRSGRAPAKQGAIGVLRRTIVRLRAAFPKAKIRVRLDGGFACPALLDFLEAQRVEYLIGLGKNQVLKRRVGRPMGTARRLSRETGQSAAVFGETRYAARSWRKNLRRVIYKAEVTRIDGREPRDNPRFVVTNLRHTPEAVYGIYRMRGESENRIKELLLGLSLDRMSCTSFRANQMRILLTLAAYVLLQTLRSRLDLKSIARKQVETLRLMLLKIGAKVHVSARRFVISLAQNHPWRDEWMTAARAWGAIRT